MLVSGSGPSLIEFEGNEHLVSGGVGGNFTAIGTITLDKDHPGNPYRHKFHPHHRSGYTLHRDFTLEFDAEPNPITNSGGYGVDRLTGVYSETIAGLHKIPLTVQGNFTLNRISQVDRLNE